MLVLYFLKNGIKASEMEFEKNWQLGHKNKGSLDLSIKKDNLIWFIEVKKSDELSKYLDSNNKKVRQLFSYLNQDRKAKFGSYYSFDFKKNMNIFRSVNLDSGLFDNAKNEEEIFDAWDQKWINRDFISEFNDEDIKIGNTLIKYKDLSPIDENDVKYIFNQFLTILRIHSVSDKSNAFDKMINLFIAKISDELSEGSKININNENCDAMGFQYINNFDDEISFLSRLNDLYKDGMKKYLKKEIVDYSKEDIINILGDNKKVISMFEDLRLKKDNAFSFIEIFDDETFQQNSVIVKDIVELLQNYQFKYNNKFQYLGDFFEELLNTSWKQESGQFFTPMPLVEMIIESLPISSFMQEKIDIRDSSFIPKAIDYACGSGHFLVSYMDKVQDLINNFKADELTSTLKKLLNSYKVNPLSWANKYVYGIEKDYRLSKTTKVSTFLNGDGEATILNGNGLAKFSADIFIGSDLASNSKENRIFDYVIANPPYSVKGFIRFLNQEGIDENDFSLINKFNINSGEIEVLFIERTAQLLKNNGIAVVILPRSILASKKYNDMRKFIFENFEISAIFESGDITFSGTTTSPVILYLIRKDTPRKKYKISVINSPKTIFLSSKEEKEFLGYEFSSNKSKLGITILNNNLSDIYSKEIKKQLLGKKPIENKFLKIRESSEIFIKYDDEIKIYPKYKKQNFVNKFKLSDHAEIIKIKESVSKEELPYVEIGGIDRKKPIQYSSKNKKSGWSICEEGDLLISSLAGTAKKWKFTIAEKSAKITDAVHILRFKNKKKRDFIFEYLMENRNNVFSDMQALLDGFKITYAKISEYNLMNNIIFEEKT